MSISNVSIVCTLANALHVYVDFLFCFAFLSHTFFSTKKTTQNNRDTIEPLVPALAANTSLLDLDLSDNRLKDNGASLLSQAIEQNQSLTTLSIQNNGITELGAEQLAKAFAKHVSLTSINAGGNNLKSLGVEHLSKSLSPQLKSLNLSCALLFFFLLVFVSQQKFFFSRSC